MWLTRVLCSNVSNQMTVRGAFAIRDLLKCQHEKLLMSGINSHFFRSFAAIFMSFWQVMKVMKGCSSNFTSFPTVAHKVGAFPLRLFIDFNTCLLVFETS